MSSHIPWREIQYKRDIRDNGLRNIGFAVALVAAYKMGGYDGPQNNGPRQFQYPVGGTFWLTDEEAAIWPEDIVKINIDNDFYTGFNAGLFRTDYYGDVGVWVLRSFWDEYVAHCKKEDEFQSILDELWTEGMKRKRYASPNASPPPNIYPTMTPLRNKIKRDG